MVDVQKDNNEVDRRSEREVFPFSREDEYLTRIGKDLQNFFNRNSIFGPGIFDSMLKPVDVGIRAFEDEDGSRNIEFVLAGVNKEDITTEVLSSNVLSVRAESHDEHNHRSYNYTVPVPNGFDIDSASATFKNGLLTISVPKASEADTSEKKTIPIS
jgi:HSP20 family protein